MKKIILKFVFRKYRKDIEEIFVQDMIAGIPKEVTDVATTFLYSAKNKMEKWLLYQSYILTRKCASDFKNATFYYGMLTQIKFLLLLTGKAPVVESKGEIKINRKKDTSLDDVDDFLEGMKTFKQPDESTKDKESKDRKDAESKV